MNAEIFVSHTILAELYCGIYITIFVKIYEDYIGFC